MLDIAGLSILTVEGCSDLKGDETFSNFYYYYYLLVVVINSTVSCSCCGKRRWSQTEWEPGTNERWARAPQVRRANLQGDLTLAAS
jgi:hypothetical protein